jgi:hypothetical protein
MVRSDILLLLDGPGRRIGVPAKLYEFIGAGRPILALAERDGDTAWVLSQSGVNHRIAAPGDSAGIQRALEELIRETRAGHDAGKAGDRHSPFARENLAGQLAGLLERCADRTATTPLAAALHPIGPPGGPAARGPAGMA